MSEILKQGRIIPKICGAALALTALAGCSTDKELSYVFEVVCPDSTHVDVSNVSGSENLSSITISCGDGEISQAPSSIELINGDAVTVNDSDPEGDILTIDYEFTEGGFFEYIPEPSLQSVSIFENSAVIKTINSELTGVQVTEG